MCGLRSLLRCDEGIRDANGCRARPLVWWPRPGLKLLVSFEGGVSTGFLKLNKILHLELIANPGSFAGIGVAQASPPAGSPGVPPGVCAGSETLPQLAAGTDCATWSIGRQDG